MPWKRKDTVAARVGDWKWVDMGSQGDGLFDVNRNIGEANDLFEEYPEVLAEVNARYENWLSEMERAVPRGPFRDFDWLPREIYN